MQRDLPSYEELIRIISNEKLKPLKIITIALCMGVIFFFMVTMIVYSSSYGSDSENGDVKVLEILLPVMAMISISMYTVVIFLGDKILAGIMKTNKLTSTEISNPDSKALITTITSFTIVRLAMFEGPAFFGIVILLMSSLWGVLNSNPVLWVGVVPMLIMLFYAAKIFPTNENVALLVQEKIYPLLKDRER